MNADFAFSPVINVIVLVIIVAALLVVWATLTGKIHDFFVFICVHRHFDVCSALKSIGSAVSG